MALNRLTDVEIKSLSGEGKGGMLSDGGNLYVRARGKGKSWLFRFKVSQSAKWAGPDMRGKVIEIGLGAYPARTLKDARRVAGELRNDLVNGIDPRERFRPDDADAEPFEKWALKFLAKRESGFKSAKHRQQWHNTLRDYVYPEIGQTNVGDVRKDDVEAALQPLWDGEKYETFSRVRMRIEAVLTFAFEKLDIDRANPASRQAVEARFDKISKRKKVKSHAAPPWQKVPAIMASLREKPGVMSALALRFSILTAARSMEVRALPWAEIDLAEKVWRLPGERAKMAMPTMCHWMLKPSKS